MADDREREPEGTDETGEGPPAFEGGEPGGEAAPGAGAETTGGGQRSGNPENDD